MRVECPHCGKTYEIDADCLQKLGPAVQFPCQSCGKSFEIRPSGGGVVASGRIAGDPAEVPIDVLKKRILRTVGDLPPMPQVAIKARTVVADEGSSFADLAAVIRTDQAIAARVLKIANSSYYGAAGKVTSLQHASVLLGMRTLNELLTLACTSGLLGSELRGYGLAAGDLWRHSLAVAGCARALALRHKPELAEEAFTAGLIHDSGKLILAPYIEERKTAFETFLAGGGHSFLEAEQQILGFDHATIACDVCQKWGIPREIASAILSHHNPVQALGHDLAVIVHAADAIALMSGVGAGVDGMCYRIDRRAMEALKLDDMAAGMVMAEAVEYVEKTISSF